MRRDGPTGVNERELVFAVLLPQQRMTTDPSLSCAILRNARQPAPHCRALSSAMHDKGHPLSSSTHGKDLLIAMRFDGNTHQRMVCFVVRQPLRTAKALFQPVGMVTLPCACCAMRSKVTFFLVLFVFRVQETPLENRKSQASYISHNNHHIHHIYITISIIVGLYR